MLPPPLMMKQARPILLLLLLFDLASFVVEGRLTWTAWTQPLDAFGGWEHHELLAAIVNRACDPSLFAGDPFTRAITHYVLPFAVVVTRLVCQAHWPLSLIVAVGEHLGRLTFAGGVSLLAWTLFKDRGAVGLALVALLRAKPALGLIQTHSAFNFNGDWAMGLCLLAMALWMRGWIIGAAVLVGAAFNLHYGYPLYTAAFLAVVWVIQRPCSLRTLGMALVAFAVCALPFAVTARASWVASTGSAADPIQWRQVVMAAVGYHYFLSLTGASDPYFWLNTILLLGSGLLAVMWHPAVQRSMQRTVWLVIVVSAVLTAVHWVASEVVLSVPVTTMLLSRSETIVLIMAGIYVGRMVSQEFRAAVTSRRWTSAALLGLGFASFAILPLTSKVYAVAPVVVAWWIAMAWRRRRRTAAASHALNPWAPAALATVTALLLILRRVTDYPALAKIDQSRAAWRDIQIWASEHTEKGALFLKPLSIAGFRTFSKRSSFGDVSDASLITLLDARAAGELIRRMEALGYRWPRSKEEAAQRFRHLAAEPDPVLRMTAPQLEALAARYGIDYLVTRKDHQLLLTPLYTRGDYVVYRLPARSAHAITR